jgi:hypothetical protein
MHIHESVLIAFAGAVMIPSISAAQARRAPATQGDTEVTVAIALRVDGQLYQFDGNASCEHAPMAAIYGVVAEMWTVQQSEEERSIALTMWRPKNAQGNWLSLSVRGGGKSYTVSTVQAPGATVQGSGKVTLAPSGAGGTFTIEATAATGAVIAGTIKCSAFTPAIAEGGD